MTVSNQTNRTSATGTNTIGQAVAFLFPIDFTSDIKVRSRVTATGVPTDLAETTNYTVTITGDTGGTVTMVTAVAVTAEIHIERNTPSTQSLDLVTGGTFNAENLETALDKNTKLTIENQDALTRTMRIPPTDATSINMELANSVDRAGKYLTFDANGEPAVTVDKTTGTASVSAFGEELIDDANAAAARTTLEAYGEGDDAVFDSIKTKGPYIDVTHPDYGAVGDGATDDTTAFDLALAAASDIGDWDSDNSDSKPAVYVPPGQYKITSQLEVLESTVLFGAGVASQLFYSSAASGNACLHIAASQSITIRDLHVSCDTANETDNTGIECEAAAQTIYIENVFISDFRDGFGLVLDETLRSTFVNVHITRCSTGIKIGDDGNDTTSNVVTFIGGSVRQAGALSDIAAGADAGKYAYLRTEGAVVIEQGQRIRFIGHTVEGSRGAAYLVLSARQFTLDSCHMENNCVFLKTGDGDAVGTLNDHSKFEIFLNAYDASNEYADDISILNTRIANCHFNLPGLRAQAKETRKIANLAIENCFLMPTLQADFGWVYGIKYQNNSDNQTDPDTAGTLEPAVIVTDEEDNEFSASSTWANDPYLYHVFGNRIVTANIYRYTIQATTETLVYAAVATSNARTYKCYADNAMSEAEIMSVLGHYGPYIPAPLTVILYLEDGTYTMASAIDLYDRYGFGNLQILGNTGESGLHTNQAVILDATTPNSGIRLFDCAVRINVDNLKITAATNPLKFSNCQVVDVNGCFLLGEADTAGDGILFDAVSHGLAEDNYVSTIKYGITAQNTATVASNNNDDSGTQPANGLYANSGVIMKIGTQPTASGTAEVEANGGDIR